MRAKTASLLLLGWTRGHSGHHRRVLDAGKSVDVIECHQREDQAETTDKQAHEAMEIRLFIYLFIEGLQPSQLHRVTSGLFTS